MAFKGNNEQHIEIGASADEALNVIQRMASAVGKTFTEILKTQGEITAGTHKQEDATRKLVQMLQRQIGEMNTVATSWEQIANKNRQGLLGGLGEQKIGRDVLAASRLTRSLSDATSAAEAFGTRYTQALAKASKAQGALSNSTQRELDALLNSQKTLQRLQGTIDRFDVKAQSKGGYTSEEFAARGKLQAQLNQLNRLARDENLSATSYAGQIKSIQAMATGLGQVNTLERQRASELAKQEAAYNKLAEQKRRLRKADDQAALAELKLQDRLGQQRDKLEARVMRDSRRREQQASNLLIPNDVRELAAKSGSAKDARAILARELVEAEKRLADAKNNTRQAELDAVRAARARLDAATRLVRLEDQAAAKAAAQLRRDRALDTRIGMATARADVTKLIGETDTTTAVRALEMNQARALRDVRRASDEEAKKAALEQLKLAERRLEIARQLAREQGKSAGDARARVLKLVNLEDAQLRSAASKGSSTYRFTEQEARGFDMRRVNADYDAAFAKLQRIRDLASKAFASPGGPTVSTLQRIQRGYDDVAAAIAKAEAQKKAFDKLPEQQAARSRQNIMNQIFGDGGLMFGARLAGIAAISSVAYGAIGAVGSTAQNVVQLEDEFNKLQAISGATDVEMRKLAGSIMEVGNNSRYSTLEIAQGATTIAQAGFSAAETAEVLRNSLDLAAASGSSPAESIDLMTSALGSFNLQAEESGRVADVITAGLNKTKLGIEQMRLSIQYVGATAKENSLSIEELVALTGLLANAGVRGSTAGTGLRQLLVDLKTPTEKLKEELKAVGLSVADIDVKSNGLDEVIRKMAEAGFSAEAAYEGLEVRAAASFLALKGQIDGYDSLSLALTQSGAAAEAAREASKGLTAQWTELKNSSASVMAELASGPLNVLTTLVSGLGEVAKSIGEVIGGLKGLGDESGVTASIIQSGLTTALTGAALGSVIPGVGTAAGGVIGALAGLFAGLMQAGDGLDALRAKSNEAEQAFMSQQQTVSSVEEAITRLIDRSQVLQNDTIAVQAETLTLSQRFENLNLILGDSTRSYDELLGAMQRLREFEAEKLAADAAVKASTLRNETRGLRDQIDTDKKNIRPASFGPGSAGEANRSTFRNLWGEIDKVTDRDFKTYTDLQPLTRLLTQMRDHRDKLLAAGKTFSDYDQTILTNLENLQRNVTELIGKETQIVQADRLQQTYDASKRVGSFGTAARIDGVRGDIRNGYLAEEDKPGSGADLITRARQAVPAMLAQLKADQAKYSRESLEYQQLARDILQVEALQRDINRRETKAAESNAASVTASNLQTVQLRMPGRGFSRTSGFGPRRAPKKGASTNHGGIDYGASAGTPVEAVADGVVTLVGTKGGYGNTVIVSHGNGLESLYGHLQDGSFKVKEGQKVTAGQILGGVGKTGTATGNHLHLEIRKDGKAVDPGNGRFQIDPSAARADGETAAEKAAKELLRLQQVRSQRRVSAAQAGTGAIISEARAGTRPVADLGSELNTLLKDLREARLEDYDLTNPLTGASGTEQTIIKEGREALIKEIEANERKVVGDYYRAVGDRVMKVLQLAFEKIDDQLELDLFAAEEIVARVDSERKMLENDTNRFTVGAGTLYRNDQERRAAVSESSRQQEVAYQKALVDQKKALAAAEAELLWIAMTNPDKDPSQVEDYVNKERTVIELRQRVLMTERELNEVLRQRREIEGSATIAPLGERLSDAARSWQESSGAFDSIGKTMENGVGPLLDNLTNGFTDFFSSVMDGSKGFKTALGDMLRSFVGFVQQMILRALALYVVNQILGAIIPGGNAATKVGGNIKGSYNGGPVVGLYQGGPTHKLPGGGQVRQGFSSHDSANYKLAHGEYVVRNKSVKDLGLPFMEAINKYGRAGAAKMMGAGQSIMNVQQPKQETNVWVVSEKQEASMGPNDVLVTIHRDILQGGATKRLIRQVAQGA